MIELASKWEQYSLNIILGSLRQADMCVVAKKIGDLVDRFTIKF